MKFQTLLFIFSLTLGAFAQTENVDKEVVLEVLKGVVEGIAEEAHINIGDIQSCISDSKVVVQDLVQAVNLIKSNKFSNVKEGIRKIGEAIQVLPDAITECQAGKEEVQQMANLLTGLLSQLRNPLHFAFAVGKNLLVNGVEILHEIETAVNDWETQNYEDFGKQVGTILYQLLVHMEYQEIQTIVNADTTVVTVFIGVLEGFAYKGGIHVEDVESCIRDTITVVLDFNAAVKNFESNDKNQILEGLRLLGAGLQVLPNAITECQATVQEAIALSQKLTAVIAQIASPQQFAFHIGKDLLVNGRDIYREISTAVKDWNEQDYNGFGFQVGEALYQIFVGVTQ